MGSVCGGRASSNQSSRGSCTPQSGGLKSRGRLKCVRGPRTGILSGYLVRMRCASAWRLSADRSTAGEEASARRARGNRARGLTRDPGGTRIRTRGDIPFSSTEANGTEFATRLVAKRRTRPRGSGQGDRREDDRAIGAGESADGSPRARRDRRRQKRGRGKRPSTSEIPAELIRRDRAPSGCSCLKVERADILVEKSLWRCTWRASRV